MPISLIILIIALISVALRQTSRVAIPIWMITVIGAIADLLFQQITPLDALKAIEPDVMLYLFGVFLICQAAEDCGYLEQVTDRIFYHAHTGNQALFVIIFMLGISAAFLMNDTIAIVGTPIILQLCKSHKNLIKPLLFALAFSITIGSVISPIGNPQNLLISVKSNMPSPFLAFIKALAIPTVINLFVIYFYVYLIYRRILNERIEKPTPTPLHNHQTVFLVRLSLTIMLILIAVKILTDSFQLSIHINFSHIAILAALPIFLSNQIGKSIRRLDWGTLLFFASIFILMQSVWASGFFQKAINHFHIPITQIPTILIISILLSQLISNVPLVALYLPLLSHYHVLNSHFLALAAGSTIAGNLSILGAASNIIIIQNMEKRAHQGLGFFEFIKLGVPLTILNALIYAYFLV